MLAQLSAILGTAEGLTLAERNELGKLYQSQEEDLMAKLEKLRRKRVGIV